MKRKTSGDSMPTTVVCPMFEKAIDGSLCTETSSVIPKNTSTCTAGNCPSPFRMCLACLHQGYSKKDARVTVEGLCDFHFDRGANANRATLRTSDADLLSDLLPAAVSYKQGDVVEVPTNRVLPFAGQPRTYFDPEELEALKNSIRAKGQLQPGVVRRIEGSERHDFELIDGERRWRCCKNLGKKFRAVVIHIAGREEQFEQSIAMNFQRADHTPMEIARAIDRLITKGKRKETYIATLFGRHPTWVNNHRKLIRLHPDLAALLDRSHQQTGGRRQLPVGVAVKLSMLPQDEQLAEFKRMNADGMSAAEAQRHLTKLTTAAAKAGGHHTRQARELSPGEAYGRVRSFLRAAQSSADNYVERFRPAILGQVAARVGEREMEKLRNDVRVLRRSLNSLLRKLGGTKR